MYFINTGNVSLLTHSDMKQEMIRQSSVTLETNSTLQKLSSICIKPQIINSPDFAQCVTKNKKDFFVVRVGDWHKFNFIKLFIRHTIK